MPLNLNNLTFIIVTFKSEDVIHQCLKSIGSEIPIMIIENSNNFQFKNDLEKKYKNVKCVLSGKNLGMGSANNLGINLAKTDYVLILNPDVILEHDTIDKLIEASINISNFAIIAPASKNIKYPNYKMFETKNEKIENELILNVMSVDGYAMLFNIKNMNKVILDKDSNTTKNYFDENFFMYLENDDLCKRVVEKKQNIFVATKSRIEHLGAQAVNKKYKYEVELSRNWHWMWSKFYFNKKHSGFFNAIIKISFNFFSSLLKYFLYSIIFNNYKKTIYKMRLYGIVNSVAGKPSWYRPKIKN